jgi:hypothetical protein
MHRGCSLRAGGKAVFDKAPSEAINHSVSGAVMITGDDLAVVAEPDTQRPSAGRPWALRMK